LKTLPVFRRRVRIACREHARVVHAPCFPRFPARHPAAKCGANVGLVVAAISLNGPG